MNYDKWQADPVDAAMLRELRQMNRGKVFLYIIAVLAFLAGCAPKSIDMNDPEMSEGTIIVVPGFKSSVLSRSDGTKVWITAQEALFGSARLTLPNEALGLRNIDLQDGGILGSVSLVPFLYGFDVNDAFLAKLRHDFPKHRIVPFHYDWRRDNIEAIRSLSALVDQERQGGARSVSLIGHSMGGLIVAYYLRYGAVDFPDAVENWHGAQRVDRVALGGVPFQGSLRMFHDMQLGSTIIFNSSLLSAEALSSFPSSYQLLPRCPGGVAIPATLEISDAKSWQGQEWGLFQGVNQMEESIVEARRKFVTDNLQRADSFSKLLHAPVSAAGQRAPRLKFLNIVGIAHRTMSKIRWNGPASPLDYDNVVMEDGDGSVLVTSAALPQAAREYFDTSTVEVDAEHGRVLSTGKGYDALRDFLSGVGS